MSDKQKPKSRAEESKLRSAVMVDIMYVKETKHLLKTNEYEYHFAKDWQVFPFFNIPEGFKYGNTVRMMVYAGVCGGSEGNMYLAQDGRLWGPEWTLVSGGDETTLLGGINCGCTEISLQNNPPGIYDRRQRGSTKPAVVREMRITAFHNMVCAAIDRTISWRPLLPCIYADVPGDDAKYRVWTPNKGFIQVAKTPIPVCLTSFPEFLPWSNAYLSKVPALWQNLVCTWLRENKAENLYLGYDFVHTPEPSDDEIDHLTTKEEVDKGLDRYIHYADMTDGDVLRGIDVHRMAVKDALKNCRFREIGRSPVYGVEL